MLQNFKYQSEQDIRVLLTADQAYPVLERAFLTAETEIWASFRVFDPFTALRSVAAKRIGETWLDLVVHTLSRGVSINIVISDFDPIARPALHQATWRSVRALTAAGELAGAPNRLKVTGALHPARTGIMPRLLFWPVILHRQFKATRWLNVLPDTHREAAVRDMPRLMSLMARKSDGRFRPKILPVPPLYPATHHQKMAVFDRKRLYLGGLDLDERRFDTPDHNRSAEETWHDVQVDLAGPAVAEAQAHLETFLDVTAGTSKPKRQRRFLRTMSGRRRNNLMSIGPEPLVEEIALAHEHYAKRTRRLIYLETQFFRDLRLARFLARLATEDPGLSLLLVLPGAPEDIAFKSRFGLDTRFGEFLQARALRILIKAFGRRMFVAGMAQPRLRNDVEKNARARLHGAPIVYIHSKVSIFDETAAIVSSANLNGRSLRWDTEAGLLMTDRKQVKNLRRKVMGHWLPKDAQDGYFDTGRAVSTWRALALSNARMAPGERQGFVLPYDIKSAERDAADVPILPEQMV